MGETSVSGQTRSAETTSGVTERTQAAIESLIERARGHILAGKHKLAVNSINKALEKAPDDWWTWWRVGHFMAESGFHDQALQFFQKSLSIEPTVATFLDSGAALMRLGLQDLADASFAGALGLDDQCAAAWHGRGVVLFALGQAGHIDKIGESLDCLMTAVDLEPENARFVADLAERLRRVGQFEEALRWTDRSLEIDPADSAAWTRKGACLGALRRHEEAAESFRRVTELEPNAPDGWLNLGLALGNVGRHDEALGCFERTIMYAPDQAVGWDCRGIALRQLGRLDEALESFGRAVEREPGSAVSWENRAAVARDLGREAEADEYQKKADELRGGEKS